MKISSEYLMSQKGLELLNNLFHSSGEGIMFFDQEGKIATVNPRAEEMFGYTDAELHGQPVEVLIPMNIRTSHVKFRQDFMKNPTPRKMGTGRDLKGLRKDKSTFPLEVSLSYITHENETLIVAFITDITVRKKNEEKLENQRIQLKNYTKELEQKVRERTSELEHMNLGLQSQIQERKLAENALKDSLEDLKEAEKEILKSLSKERELGEMKSRFVSMASHEFRTPLTTILSSANLITKYVDNEGARTRHVDRIKKSVRNLTSILNDFLSLEKLESGLQEVHLSEVDLQKLIREVKEDLSGMLKPDQEVLVFMESESMHLETDSQIAKNILLNLLSNAIKYSPEKAQIEIRIKDHIEDASGIVIEVVDKGIGIPKEDQSFLFERFHRAQNATNIQGTGLGLHIVKKYTELLKGSITFESEEGKGSSFSVILPKKE
ncbi:MAG: PAS domain-containing sensor histidine kinase [Bacteroidota bacterium]